MMTSIWTELFKIFRKWRTYISFITVGAVIIILEISVLTQGQSLIGFLRNLADNFEIVGNFVNGYLVAYMVLVALSVHIPFLIALVGGDLLAGEAAAGTYRLILTRPQSRTLIATSKLISGLIYTLMLVLFLALMSAGLGTLLLGTGELVVLSNKIIIFKAADAAWRLGLAYGFAFISMSAVMSLSMMFSSLANNSIGPIVATMAVIIIFLIISTFEFGFLADIQPYLFTYYMTAWNSLFEDPPDMAYFTKSCLVLTGHTVFFYIVTLFIFNRKDITS